MMRKISLIKLSFTWACIAFSSMLLAQGIIISEVVDGTGPGAYPKYVELTNTTDADFVLDGYKINRYSNGNTEATTAFTFGTYSLPTGESIVLTNIDNATSGQLWSDFNLTAPTNVEHSVTDINGNGDDVYELADASDATVDVYGVIGVDGTDQTWEYTDSYAYRNSNIKNPNATFTDSEWTFGGVDAMDDQSADLSGFLTPGTHTFSTEASTETDIVTFTFVEQSADATIDAENHTVTIEVVYGTSLTALVPTITVSAGATIDPASGVAQDFSSPVSYTVTAEDETTTQDWTVTVTVADASVETDILTFAFAEQTGAATINATEHTVAVEVVNGTEVTSLTPTITISTGATIDPASGVEQDFTNPVIYTVTAEDESTTQNWTVTVTVAEETTGGLFFSEYIEGSSNNRAFELFNGSGSAIDLSNYVVMQSRSSAGWAIRDGEFMVAYVLSLTGTLDAGEVYVVYNNEADASIAAEGDLMLTYSEAPGSRNASFTGNDAMGLFEVVGNDTVLIDVIGTEILESSSTWDVAGVDGATQDHTLIRKLTVTEGNATEWDPAGGVGSAGSDEDDSEWIVFPINTFDFIGYHGANSATDILTFELAEQTGEATINTSDHSVDIEVSFGTDVTSLTPTITLSYGASIAPESGVAQDFTNPFTYTVTAEDGTTTQDWTVTVTVASSQSTETDILSFELAEQYDIATIDTVNHTVHIYVVPETNLTALVPTIEVSVGATISPESGVAQDFTNPVDYTVTAEDGNTTQEWVVTVEEFVPSSVSIYDIQYTEDPSGDSPLAGQRVIVSGIVTAVEPGGGFFLQDAPGLWNGIYVYTPTGDIGVLGDSVVFSGEVTEYFGLTELSWVEDFQVISSDHDIYEPVTLTASQMTEGIEGVLIHLEEFTCVNVDFDDHDNSLYVNENEPNDTLMVHDLMYEFEPVLNYEYTFTGIGNFDWDNFKVEPRDSNDVEILTVVNNPPVIENVYVSPESPTIDDEVYILADIIDDVEVVTKAFYYGTSLDDISNEITLEPVGFGGIQFRALLPEFTEVTWVYYKFEATDVEYAAEFVDSIYLSDIPLIENVTIAPEEPVTAAEAIITATITDAEEVDQVLLYWSMDENAFDNNLLDTMVVEEGAYTGTIEIPMVTKYIATIYFKIEATDMLANVGVYLDDFEADIQGSVLDIKVADQFYPNPVKDMLYFKNMSEFKSISVTSISGKELFRMNDYMGTSIDVSDLLPGIYFIITQDKSGKTQQFKFIKQ